MPVGLTGNISNHQKTNLKEPATSISFTTSQLDIRMQLERVASSCNGNLRRELVELLREVSCTTLLVMQSKEMHTQLHEVYEKRRPKKNRRSEGTAFNRATKLEKLKVEKPSSSNGDEESICNEFVKLLNKGNFH
ncbi:hypothetical protein YC2023_038119 [Brassica napus]